MLILSLLARGFLACNVSLQRIKSGTCSSSRFGCGPSSLSPRSMFTKRGCCGVFECDGIETDCCSHSHAYTTYCACGPAPEPKIGGTFYVSSNAPPGGNGTLQSPFSTIQDCVDVAAYATSFSTCSVAPGVYREGTIRVYGQVAIVGAGANETILDGTLELPQTLNWTQDNSGSGVYQALLPNSSALRFPIQQLFVDDTFVPVARWPNANLSTMLDVSTWATMKWGSDWGDAFDPALATLPDSLDSARVTMNLGSGVYTWVRQAKLGYSRTKEAGVCSVTLTRELVPHSCEGATRFGCDPSGHPEGEYMWTKHGCSGIFTCNGHSGVRCTSSRAIEGICACSRPSPSPAPAPAPPTRDRFRYETALIGLKRPSSPSQTKKLFENNRYYLDDALALLDSPGEWWLNRSSWTLHLWPPDGRPPSNHRLSAKAYDYCLRMQSAGRSVVANLTMRGCTVDVEGCNNCTVSDVDLVFPTFDAAWRRGLDTTSMPPATTVDGVGAMITRIRLSHSNTYGLLMLGSRHRVENVLIESTDWLGSLDFPPLKIGFTAPRPPSSHGLDAGVGMVGGADNVVERATIRGFGNSGICTSQLSNQIRLTHVTDGGLLGGDNACVHADNTPTDCAHNNCTKVWSFNWVHNCREKCVRCDDGSQNCTIHNNVVFNCGKPLRNGSPAGVLLKGFGHRVWDLTLFNTSAGQGDLCAITQFGQNKNSEFWNIAARRIGTRGGPAITTNGTCAFEGGILTGYECWQDLRLADPLAFNFSTTSASPLRDRGVVHTPGVSSDRDVGAYQRQDAWRPGCTFHPRCGPLRPPWPR